MSAEEQAQTITRDVRITIENDLHQQIEKIQAFIQFTTGSRPKKPDACVLILKHGIERYDQIMRETISA